MFRWLLKIATSGINGFTSFAEALIFLWSGLEIFFGLTAFFFSRQPVIRLIYISLYSVFSAVSLFYGLSGHANCNCFGRLTVNPLVTFVIDVIILSGLVFFAPFYSPKEDSSASKGAILGTIIGILGLSGLLIITAYIIGSYPYLYERFQDQKVLVTAPEFNLGTGKKSSLREFSVSVSNVSGREIRITGGTSSCSCLATSDLPVDIAPGQEVALKVKAKFAKEPGPFRHQFFWYTNSPDQKFVLVSFFGTVEE